jgi:hypothetical protein
LSILVLHSVLFGMRFVARARLREGRRRYATVCCKCPAKSRSSAVRSRRELRIQQVQVSPTARMGRVSSAAILLPPSSMGCALLRDCTHRSPLMDARTPNYHPHLIQCARLLLRIHALAALCNCRSFVLLLLVSIVACSLVSL